MGILNQKIKLLHVAPEILLSQVFKLNSNIDYITADLYSENVMVKMDITKIQYPDHHFDAILCNHVLEHVDDDKRAMSELFRVLKPGGWAILQVPIALALQETYEDCSITSPTAREVAFGQSDHVRLYGNDYTDKLQATGFIVNIFDWWTNESKLFGGKANQFGLIENESLCFAARPFSQRLNLKTQNWQEHACSAPSG